MQLCYFLPPYHILNSLDNDDRKLSVAKHMDSVTMLNLDKIMKQEPDIGYSAIVALETSPRPNLLPTGSLYCASKQHSSTLDPLPLGSLNR